jgi:hypothetical protein
VVAVGLRRTLLPPAAASVEQAVDRGAEEDAVAAPEEGAGQSVDEADEAADDRGDEEVTAVASGLTGAPVPPPVI